MKAKSKEKIAKRKPESERDSVSAALLNLLSDSIKRKPSGIFVMLPFRVFEMLRFPKGKHFFCPQISDDQFFSLLPQRAADLLKDLMELDNPADRLSVFQDLEARSEMQVEIQKKLRVQDLEKQFGFKSRAAERLVSIGGDRSFEAVQWLSKVIELPDKRTRKMLLFLLQPVKGKKLRKQDIVDRLEFARIPLPQVRSSEDFIRIISTAYEALRIGFPFKKVDG